VRFYVVAQDITERKDREAFKEEIDRLTARFKKEQAQNVLIQRMISALDHDLRTSLTVIGTSKDVLSRYYDRMDADKRQEKLDTIGRQLRYVVDLLDDTVQLVRGNLSEIDFNPAPVNLAALCQISIDEISATSRAHHRFSFRNPGRVGVVTVDDTLISRILLNLLSNAMKYSPEGGDIRLELDRGEVSIILRVVDHGYGIHDDDMPHIFEPFFRSEAARGIQGTGLGLNIVKDCVERHGGHIAVSSTPGQGSVFSVFLPV
jgi:signal transduction histidine kinase